MAARMIDLKDNNWIPVDAVRHNTRNSTERWAQYLRPGLYQIEAFGDSVCIEPHGPASFDRAWTTADLLSQMSYRFLD